MGSAEGSGRRGARTRHELSSSCAGLQRRLRPRGSRLVRHLRPWRLLWVAIVAPRNASLDRYLPLPGFWRTLVWNLPDAVRQEPVPVGWVMGLDLDGRPEHDLRTDDRSCVFLASVAERSGVVVTGSRHEADVAVLAPSG